MKPPTTINGRTVDNAARSRQATRVLHDWLGGGAFHEEHLAALFKRWEIDYRQAEIVIGRHDARDELTRARITLSTTWKMFLAIAGTRMVKLTRAELAKAVGETIGKLAKHQRENYVPRDWLYRLGALPELGPAPERAASVARQRRAPARADRPSRSARSIDPQSET